MATSGVIVINKYNLKLNDINKEMEYNTQKADRRNTEITIMQVWIQVAIFGLLLIEQIL